MAVRYYDGTTEYEGCVFNKYEHNGYNDSDFYAECVNIETGKIDTVEYDTTRCGGNGTAEIDLTETNYRLYQKAAYGRQIKDGFIYNRNSAVQVAKGKEVKVVKGRKVPIGTVGVVFWRKECNYDRYQREWHTVMRIGIKTADGNTYFLSEQNVEVVDPEQYLATPQEIIKACKKGRSKSYLSFKKAFNW